MARLLFYSGSVGLGHVTRDVAIAHEIRKLRPDTEIDWLAASPAREFLEEQGERIHPEADRLGQATAGAEALARPGRLNITMWAFAARKQWAKQAQLALSLIQSGLYDAVIGDETYDLAIALLGVDSRSTCPCFILYDFLGLDRMTMNPMEWVVVAAFNRVWGSDPRGHYQPVFLGEREDIPLRRFGLFHEARRGWAEHHAAVVGHALQFDPFVYTDRPVLRSQLGYGPEPLVLVSVGGTAVGSELLNLCLEAFPQARRDIPGLRMVLACGPRLSMADRILPEGVEVKGYVPRLFEHFAACDLAIVQGGGTSTLELTSLKRPFLFFPLESHCEQLKHVAPRQERLGAGVRLRLRDTTPADLGKQIAVTIKQEVSYPSIKVDGAHGLARIVTRGMR